MSKYLALLVVAMFLVPATPAWAVEPKVKLLWPDGAPGALGDEPKDEPTLTIWLPDGRGRTSQSPKEPAVESRKWDHLLCPYP
jgi:hypothetical protein